MVMKSKNRYIKLILCLFALLAVILDSRSSALGAAAGIEICVRSAIPSLFPAMVLTDIMVRSMDGIGASAISKLLIIPKGAESIYLAGILGGYPMGARLIGQHYSEENLSKADAQYMLTFCSNAGPAFIFGLCGPMFSTPAAPAALWVIQICASLLVAKSKKRKPSCKSFSCNSKPLSLTQIVINCTKTMAVICGWIVLFRVLMHFLENWFLWMLSSETGTLLKGILELTIGCCGLGAIVNESSRFLICTILLSFGGLCVCLQTRSLINGLSMMHYIKGKLLQTLYATLISVGSLSVINYSLPISIRLMIPALSMLVIAATVFYFQKHIAFPKNMIYNTKKQPVR